MKRLSLRARLTLIYGGLFLVAGLVLLAVTYVLVEQRTAQPFGVALRDVKPVVQATETKLNGVQAEQLRLLVNKAQDDARDQTLYSLLTQGGIALVLVSVVAIAFGWLVAGRALQPLHQITGTARRIAGADVAGRGLHERLSLSGPRDEVRELADTFDEMVERLDRSFDGQRRFVANASHELRTPLALNRSLIELAVTRPGASEDVRRLGESLLAVNERHERLIDGLLTLADSENELTARSRVDLADVVDHVVDLTVKEGDGPAVARELAPAPVLGDPVLLERLTTNLVENAVRHNVPAGGWIGVGTGVRDGRATLTVSNTGPLVPGYDVETIFEPFRRLSGERVGSGRGFGLGLSIVRAVARAHGGTVTARPRDGGGLDVTVELPAT
ncbi:HAMP domain-containing sensor histidine kinase [Micromonospora sp. C28SCA-DRY-2]|uniref:sensor histidine kinase n=1 Tax=Micromonospora sp. C28SCA-DRY-2 TaxID=3059522 RepID=UPI0026751EE2|nr:HAMP domain-containing sensor histidine kinase [Micromonospora sp. C28SCA-DRY-2]MDO3703590.1 HAMP domain-containing sensor histidine kinase [Micromonospora sp. C28SCA-DRY-2]